MRLAISMCYITRESRFVHACAYRPYCIAIGLAAWPSAREEAPLRRPRLPINASADPLLRGFEFRSIGPATMMGRVDDIAGADKDPMTSGSGSLRAASGSPPTAATTGSRCSILTPTTPSARSRLRHRTRTSCMSGPARPITARVRRSATACGAPPMAGSTGPTSDSPTRSRSRRVAVDPTNPEHRLRGGNGAPVRTQSGARAL